MKKYIVILPVFFIAICSFAYAQKNMDQSERSIQPQMKVIPVAADEATLVNGSITIMLPDSIGNSYSVLITPRGPVSNLYVGEKTNNYFIVKGDSDVAFDYFIFVPVKRE